LRTFETVAIDTPTAAAMSFTVTIPSSPLQGRGTWCNVSSALV
jgi:hypothetical protein